jgi:cobalt-zinc-cadmium efflux system membrane fusion protein
MPLKHRLSLIAVCAGVLLPLAACQRANTGGQAPGPTFIDDHGLLSVPENSPLRSHLAVQPVTSGATDGGLEIPAAIEADPTRVTNVVAPLTGRIVALKVGLGDHVRKGQILAILASGDFAQAQSDVDKAEDAQDLARKALDRARGVQNAGGGAVKDLEAAQSAYNQAAAELVRAQARLLDLNGDAASGSHDLTLTAPQSGVVTTLAVGAGALVDDPTATLMTVADLDRVFVTANVSENDIGKVAAGTDADIILTADPSHPLHGKVSEVDAVLQPDIRRQKARITLANPGGRLLPNMYATVRLAARQADGVFVPQSALLMNNDTTSVLVEVRPWVFQRRAVRIGDETEATARVLSGLAPGDRVVTRGGILFDD